MKIKKMKNFIAVICSLILMVCSNQYVGAETDPKWGSQSPAITVPKNLYNPVWKTPMEAAAIAWNNTATKVTVGTSTSSPNTVTLGSYGEEWYGSSTSANPGPFTIKLNYRTIQRDASNLSNFIQSVMVHEYGHIFCLEHTSRTSIMNNRRDRNTMITPQVFDISEVNSVYK